MKKSFRGSASFSNLGCVSEVIATHIIFFLNKSQGYQSDLPYYDQFGIQSQNSETNAKKVMFLTFPREYLLNLYNIAESFRLTMPTNVQVTQLKHNNLLHLYTQFSEWEPALRVLWPDYLNSPACKAMLFPSVP